MKVKLIKGAIMPRKGRPDDAGYDLFLPKAVTIRPNATTVIDTGVCVELPKGHAGLIAIRSSIAKMGFVIQNPLIDGNYRGELHVIVTNPYPATIEFSEGERICSLYVFPVYGGALEKVDELSESDRGESWSGSSGK